MLDTGNGSDGKSFGSSEKQTAVIKKNGHVYEAEDRQMTFAVGEYLVYGVSGVCEVTAICASPYDKSDPRQYYALRPYHERSGSLIYTPAEGEMRPMRALLSGEEAEALLREAAALSPLEVPFEKMRRDTYRRALGTLDPKDLLRILKTVEKRRCAVAGTRKRLPDVDLDFEARAKKNLLPELSLSLSVSYEEAEARLAAVTAAV